MPNDPSAPQSESQVRRRPNLIEQLRARGVLRVAASYAVIAWLALQIADVTFEPFDVPRWVMIALIITAALGLPVAIAFAWFYEFTPAGVAADAAPAAVARPAVHGIRRYADAIVITALLVVVAVLLARRPSTEDGVLEASLAIMPFTNIGGDPNNEYLSDGLTEELIDQIGRVPGLRVSARSSSFYFKGQNVDPVTAAGKLDVAAVLEGSVRRQGEKLRISVRLINGSNGFQLWSSTFDRGSADLLRTQQEIASSVVESLMPRFTTAGGKLPAAITSDVTAYDLYLLGRFQQRLETEAGDRKAIGLYRRAVAADPQLALGHAALGSYLLQEWRSTGDANTRAQAEASIRRAVAISPQLSEVQEALGDFYWWTQQPGAGEAFRRAVELNSNNASGLSAYAWYLDNAGNPREGIEMLRRALAIDPALLSRYDELATMAAGMERREEAHAVVQKAFAFFGRTAATHLLAGSLDVEGGLGEEDVCVAHLLLARRLDPGLRWLNTSLAVCLLRMGILDTARIFAEAAVASDGTNIPLTFVLYQTEGHLKALEHAQSVLRPDRPRDRTLVLYIASELTALGRPHEALELYESLNMPSDAESAIRRRDGHRDLADVAAAYIETGNAEEGARLARFALAYFQRLRANGGVNRLEEAADLAVLGREDEALKLLTEQAALLGIWSNQWLYQRPAYKNLRNDPRLKKVAAISTAHWASVRERLPKTLKSFGLTMDDLAAAARDAADKTITP